MSNHDSLGDRMKQYESAYRHTFPRRMPLIVRVDGKAFHRWTRSCRKPFDANLITVMNFAASALCSEIQGSKMAYVQSDEISVLINSYETHETQPWFDNQLQKIVSVSAAIAAATVTREAPEYLRIYESAYFDARAFVLPESEVANYFLWRQNDASRNSVQMLARSLASHSECNNKNLAALMELAFQRGQNWNDLPTHFRRGRCLIQESFEADDGTVRNRWTVDNEIPIWKGEARSYIERFLAVKE